MKKYWSVAKCSLQVTLTYPMTTIIHILISLISFVLMLNLWNSIFHGRSTIAGYQWNEMLAYLLIVFIINTDVNSEYRCAKKIINGSIAMTLVKPISHSKYTLAEIGSSIVFTSTFNLMIGLLVSIFMNVYITSNIIVIIFFIVSFINALLIKYLIVYSSSLLSFWTHNVQGVMWTRVAVVSFFSGALIPLDFLPTWLKELCELLPFQTIINTPIKIYLAKINYTEMLILTIIQFLWILVFYIIVKIVFRYGLKKVNINGG
ncbi:ABC-2 family transporter protein [Halalkalibacter sp. APA_J-10(15)]|uniref:ABC transporter permease n=1 Tax=Halalkalibacter sp. APA_J-10(15) TaxID=2933805 RepID=UPI001FF56A68|nr:ABC-2 family transporter protein [Halalkalibacter sp. APA_J-10(15)]MCK0473038.1 ABC-2 family transporter protein [Halalkalibacter sp. APA_J-10(15)]